MNRNSVCSLIVIVFVLALKLHMLMLVSPHVSFLFPYVVIGLFVLFFVQATSFNEGYASLVVVAFQVLYSICRPIHCNSLLLLGKI